MFKLTFDIPTSEKKISLRDPVYLTGSCFSDSIGEKLSLHKFKTLSNPFGTLYNPISIFKTLSTKLDPTHSIESQGVFYHWDCHGKISGLTKGELHDSVSHVSDNSLSFLENANFSIITLGTSFVYKLNSSGNIVANCHKLPSDNFSKFILSMDEITDSFKDLHETLKKNLTIIFTVSPVRHIRDGLVENNLSKAILIESVHELVSRYENVYYFPAYEIMNDELRDYRFFANDMVHPSPQAVDYIWEKFIQCYCDTETLKFMSGWNKIMSALQHTPFQPKSKEHQKFLNKTLEKLNELGKEVDVTREIETIENQLS